ncbi:hypothetical protein ANO14919_019490 [Xylariales sp. No.14919]|nr:hypothetical protein ANO14919_019490 [Xylariales sp. No.14919]
MSSRGTYTISMPTNMSPPNDLASYSRSMHSHTKKQMEAANMAPTRRTGGPSQNSPVPTIPNGTSTSSSGYGQTMNGHE